MIVQYKFCDINFSSNFYCILFIGPGTKKSAKEKLTDTMYKDAGDEHDAPHHELDHTPHDLFVEMAELIGKIKKYAFKKIGRQPVSDRVLPRSLYSTLQN